MDAFLGKLPIDMYCLASGSIWPEESKDGREVTTFSTKCVHNQSPFATKAIVYVPMHRPSGGEFLSHDEWSNAVAELHEVYVVKGGLDTARQRSTLQPQKHMGPLPPYIQD